MLTAKHGVNVEDARTVLSYMYWRNWRVLISLILFQDSKGKRAWYNGLETKRKFERVARRESKGEKFAARRALTTKE